MALAYTDFDTTGMVLVPLVQIEIEVVVGQGNLESFLPRAFSFARSMINYQIIDMTFDNLVTTLISLKYWRNSHGVDQELNLRILNRLEITCTKEYSQRCPIESVDSLDLNYVPDCYCLGETHLYLYFCKTCLALDLKTDQILMRNLSYYCRHRFRDSCSYLNTLRSSTVICAGCEQNRLQHLGLRN